LDRSEDDPLKPAKEFISKSGKPSANSLNPVGSQKLEESEDEAL
jgi:hypothetical protein